MTSYEEQIAQEIPKNAFALAGEMLAELGKDKPQHLSGYWESRRQFPAPQGVSTVTHEYDQALKLLEVALRAALDDKEGRVRISKVADGTEIRMTIENQKDPLNLPLKATAAKLEEMQKLLSDSRNWVKDEEGNYRHAAVFEQFHQYGLSVFPFSCGMFDDFTADLFRPHPGAPVNDPKTLVKTDAHGMLPVGLCLSYPKVEQLAATVGFSSPVRSK